MVRSFDGSKINDGEKIREPCNKQDSHDATNDANADFMLSYLLIDKSIDFCLGQWCGQNNSTGGV